MSLRQGGCDAGPAATQPAENHLEDILTLVDIGSGTKRQLDDVRLSGYACYRVV